MTNYKKKLIEVAIPLEAINKAAGKEKNIHTGLPSNLHTWWSRKPLGVARAALFACLVDDPSEYSKSSIEEHKKREYLFSLVEDLADVYKGMQQNVLDEAKKEILKSNDGKMPVFWDPFCGGGSLPLEALRLGLNSFATDLNPVAVFITRVMIELVPKYAHQLPINPEYNKTNLLLEKMPFEGVKNDVLFYGNRILNKLSSSLEDVYPTENLPSDLGGGEKKIIAWIWARTVECPNPSCSVTAPLVNKFWLSTHKGNEVFAHPILNAKSKKFTFDIKKNGVPLDGTVKRTGAICLACNNPISFEYIRKKGVEGKINYQLMAMVVEGNKSRIYLPPNSEQEKVAAACIPSEIPNSELPSSALGFRVQKYGILHHKDLFTKRQLLGLAILVDEILNIRSEILKDSNGNEGYADLIQVFLSLSLSRLAQTNNTLVRWLIRKTGTSKGTPAFDRQIVSMVWEFSEGNILGESVGSWKAALKNPLTALKSIPFLSDSEGFAKQADAASEYHNNSNIVISTDPPYFDAIGYADLSDFFYIWLRRTMKTVHPDIFQTLLVPKSADLTVNLGRKEVLHSVATEQFLDRLYESFKNIYQSSSPHIPVSIYYAFKQTSNSSKSKKNGFVSSNGWETLLDGLIRSGFQITGTWPLRTESSSRLRAIGSNALATSILLICRKKEEKISDVLTRAEFIRALKRELPKALAELQVANISPADIPQSAIGPGMGIFSRYEAVLESDDSPMTVKTALQLINKELDDYFNDIQGDFDSETRFAITWFEQNGMEAGDYGIANNLAQARGISVEEVKHAGLVESSAGKVRLLKRDEMLADWQLDTDNHLTVWECCQYLIYRLDQYGEEEAARLLKAMGAEMAETSKELAYILYDIAANKRKEAKEATAYNSLIAIWSDLTTLAATLPAESGGGQLDLDV